MANLAISNIAWPKENDKEIYSYMKELGFAGLEIAPTRLFEQNPYSHIKEAEAFAQNLKRQYGFEIVSMQSIWFGITQNIFGSGEDRGFLINYTKKAIDFAAAAGIGNIVFGCPKNRVIPDISHKPVAIDFFKELGSYAVQNDTVIAIEANPAIYNTNFINHTAEAFAICREVNSSGVKVNVDTGTIIYNNESLEAVKENIELVNHIHISEPHLAAIECRGLHKELKELAYNKFFSVEMKNPGNTQTVKNVMLYIKEVFQ